MHYKVAAIILAVVAVGEIIGKWQLHAVAGVGCLLAAIDYWNRSDEEA